MVVLLVIQLVVLLVLPQVVELAQYLVLNQNMKKFQAQPVEQAQQAEHVFKIMLLSFGYFHHLVLLAFPIRVL